MIELVREGVSGVCFNPGDADDLAVKVGSLVHNPDRLDQMRLAARRQFEAQYTARASYDRLREIYDLALSVRHEKEIAPRMNQPSNSCHRCPTIRIRNGE